AYRFLKDQELDIRDMSLHLAALKKLGVPYSDEMVENAIADAYGQATPDSNEAQAIKSRYGEATNVRAFDGDPRKVTEMDALVAYLQILGRLTEEAHKQSQTAEASQAEASQ